MGWVSKQTKEQAELAWSGLDYAKRRADKAAPEEQDEWTARLKEARKRWRLAHAKLLRESRA